MNIPNPIRLLPLLAALAVAGCAGDAPAADTAETAPSASASPAAPAASASSAIAAASQTLPITMASAALGRDMNAYVYLPPGYDAGSRYPVLYLLHGYGGNGGSWFSMLRYDAVADRLIGDGRIAPLIIVAPDYDNSFGVNSKAGEGVDPGTVSIGSYEEYLIGELVPYIDGHYATVAAREGRCIGGASMGGYAASYLGFTHADLFSRIGAHSAALWDYSDADLYIDQRDWLYPGDTVRQARDPFLLAKSKPLQDVEVYVDVGTEDTLAGVDRAFYETLQAAGIPSRWVPNAGGHDAIYWSGQAENYLLFYAGSR